jgi:hypothetical protein
MLTAKRIAEREILTAHTRLDSLAPSSTCSKLSLVSPPSQRQATRRRRNGGGEIESA